MNWEADKIQKKNIRRFPILEVALECLNRQPDGIGHPTKRHLLTANAQFQVLIFSFCPLPFFFDLVSGDV